jgi:putative drug exporter of the RND superfamily
VLARVADLTWRHPKAVLAVVGALAIAGGAFARDVEDHLKAAGFTDSATESEQGTSTLREALGYNPNPAMVVLVRAPGGGPLDTTSPAVRSEVGRISAALTASYGVGRVTNPLTEPTPERLIAGDGYSLVIPVYSTKQDLEDAGGLTAEDAEKRIGHSSLDVSLGGYAPSFNEVNDQTRDDLTKAEMIALPILTVLLLLVFRGVIAAAIPLLIGVLGIVLTFAVLRVMAGIVDTSLFALNIGTGLSLGLAVDYSLLLVSRYREELERVGPTHEAHARTVATAGRAALFSGGTVAVALLALVLMPQRFLYSLGIAGATVAILSSLLALFVVPSILAIAGPRINALSIRGGPAVSDESRGWYRLAYGVMARPVLTLLASTALLLAAASPLLFTKLTGPSAEAVPPSLPSYDTNQYIDDHYSRGLTEAITVTIEGQADPAQLNALDTRILGIDGIVAGTPFTRASPTVAFANFTPAERAVSSESQGAVREIRDLSRPGTIYVSGNTAGFLDQKSSLTDHAPLVLATVALAMFTLLFLLTGSVVLPIKTLLMNALTLAATLGLIVLAFQEGWLDGLFDYQGPAAIEVVSLVFLFSVIFGLATDYAVLVLARIKEVHDSGASNEEAVATGIARTGRVITAAALMIAVVFLAFSVSPVFFMKQIAFGMAIGVLIDATIVRALLVPSLMRLFGEWNWWAPRPLRRLYWRFGLNET